MADILSQATCLCGTSSLLNPVESFICLSKKDTHWCCALCAPKYICLKHNRRCVATFTLWGKTITNPVQRQCAFGCVQACNSQNCPRQVKNMPIVLQFGLQFKSYAYFKDYINSNQNRVAYVKPGLPHSLFVLQLCKKRYAQFDILSLYGPLSSKCTFTLRLSTCMFGKQICATFCVEQQCTLSPDTFAGIALGKQTCTVHGHADTLQLLQMMWPYCTVCIDSVQLI